MQERILYCSRHLHVHLKVCHVKNVTGGVSKEQLENGCESCNASFLNTEDIFYFRCCC